MPTKKPNKYIRYKRGNVEIEGETSQSYRLMLIDLITSRITIILGAILLVIRIVIWLSG